jgi:hypothetical protein
VNTTHVEELIFEKQDKVSNLYTAVELSVKTVHSTLCESWDAADCVHGEYEDA